MKKIFIMSLLYLFSISLFAASEKYWNGVVVFPSKSVNLMIPAGMHEKDMKLSCDAEIVNYKANDKIAIKIYGSPVILYQEKTHIFFKHVHLFGEPAIWPIGIINLDDTAIIRFIDCKSSYY